MADSTWEVTEKTPPGYLRIYFIHKGLVEYISHGKPRILERDNLYILPSASSYKMIQDPEDFLECTFMHLDISPAAVTDLINLDIPDNSALRHILNALSISIDYEDDHMIDLLSGVFTAYCEDRNLFTVADKRITKALSHISQNYENNITVEDLAFCSGYNPQYFIRLFKEATGLSPHKYLIKFRLKEARKLLSEDMSISEIASRTGFYDVNSFSRAFRREYKNSPTVCREQSCISP